MTIHRLSKSRIYNIYRAMRARCRNRNKSVYYRYGGRGIKCTWDTFNDFKLDMMDSYISHVKKHGEKNTTIERIDNDDHYCKSNCRWATTKEQSRNKSNNRILELNGIKKTLTDWAEYLEIDYNTLCWRLKNWKDLNKILTLKIDLRKKRN